MTFDQFLNRIPFTLMGMLLLLEVWSARRVNAGSSRRDRGSYWVLHVGMIVAFVLTFALSRWRPFGWPTRLGHWAPFVGFAVGLLGWGLRAWAISTLGTLFTRDVRVAVDQTVVRSGPFRWARHPSYAGLILEAIGVGLAVRSWLSVAIVTVLVAGVLLYRVAIEERALVETLGDDYVQYRRRTRRFVPFIV